MCPNNREVLPKRRKKKGEAEETAEPAGIVCHFRRKIGGPKEKEPARVPDAEKTRPVLIAQGA